MTTKPLMLYGLANCDTVKKARAWLQAQGVPHGFHDFKKVGLPAADVDQWLTQVDWAVLINRQGSTWRKLSPAEQAAVVNAASARALAVLHPSVIKRPVAVWPDGQITVGFAAMVDKAS